MARDNEPRPDLVRRGATRPFVGLIWGSKILSSSDLADCGRASTAASPTSPDGKKVYVLELSCRVSIGRNSAHHIPYSLLAMKAGREVAPRVREIREHYRSTMPRRAPA